MMELFGLVEGVYSSISGVSMVPGTFNSFPSFHLRANAVLARPTRYGRVPTPTASPVLMPGVCVQAPPP